MATKTIDEYKKDYAAAKAAGDAAGMKAANDGANAVRAASGQAAQVASADIQKVAQSGQSQANGSATAYTSPTPVQANSAAGVNVNTSTQDDWKREMNENSNAWWTATPEERTRLEARNKELASWLGGTVSFDQKTGTWSGTADKISVPRTVQTVSDNSSWLEDMYAAKKRSALAQLDNAYQKNVNAINRAGEGIGTQYQNARNQAAGASELAARNFNEYAAASGLNSGAGGQAELARNVALQNNLNDISTQESSTLADLELQRANAETEYNNAIAQAEATGDYELAAALYQEKVRVEEALINQQIQQFQMDLQKYQLGYQADRDAVSDSQWQQQFGYNANQDQRDFMAKYGWQALSNGMIPSSEMLNAMGITSDAANAFLNTLQLNASLKKAGNNGGTDGGNDSGVKQDYDSLFKAAMESGHPKSFIANNYKQYGFTSSSGLYDDYNEWSEAESTPSTGNAAGQSANSWDGIDMNSVTALGYGPVSRAYLEQLVDSGVVEAYEGSNGLIQFRKTGKAPGNPMGNLFQINL